MIIRIMGVLLVIMAALLIVFSIWQLFASREMGESMTELGSAFKRPIDSADWSHHWRVSMYSLLLPSLVLLVCGIGMIQRKQWSLIVFILALILSAIADAVLYVAGYSKYAFETHDPWDVIILVILVVSACVGLIRWPKQEKAVSCNT